MANDKSAKRLEIEQKQKDLQVASLSNKVLQFDIKILELEEEIERVSAHKSKTEEALKELYN